MPIFTVLTTKPILQLMSMLSNAGGKKGLLLPVLLIAAGVLLAFTRPLLSMVSPVKLEVKILPAPVIMPSIYKVYANSDALEGKYSLFKMLVTNKSSTVAENVEVGYKISNFIDNGSCPKINKILPGQTIVVNCYPNFPDKIIDKTTSSKEKVNITIKGANIKTIEEDFDIQCKGRNEFMYSFLAADDIRTAADAFDNKELLSCLVTPEDPIIKYLTQKIQEKVLKGEAASVENKEQEGVRVMSGIYHATYLSHMVYSGTSGVPEKVGDVNSIVQSIRLPREVVTGKTGLCIELSLMYASVMMCAGMDPVVYLIPGHAYPGFRMNGHYYAIEATSIGGEGMAGGRQTVDQALQIGNKNLDEFIKHYQYGDPGYQILDVRESIKNGAIAMELKDDNFLRQKIDEIAQSFGGGIPQNVRTNPVQNNVDGGTDNSGSGGGNNNTGLPSGYNLYEGVVTFGYPASWRILPRTQYTMPQSKHVFANSSKNTFLEVYSFPGYGNPEDAIRTIQQSVSNLGGNLQYRRAGQAGGYTIFNGTTTNNTTGFNWVAAFKNTGNGVGGIAVGAYFGVNAETTAKKILNTLR
jgi:hypothetical protein